MHRLCTLNCRAEKKATKLPTKRTVRNLKADNIRALGLKLDTEDWKTVNMKLLMLMIKSGSLTVLLDLLLKPWIPAHQ
jgi:hypothetical protein